MAEESETKSDAAPAPPDEASEPAAATESGPESAAAAAEPEAAAAAEPDATQPASAAAEPKTSVQRSGDGDGAALDASGRERPRFLLAFPDHPDIKRLTAAFEAGNYALVRAEAEAVAERAESPEVRDAALELQRRIEPDPLAKYLLALTAALLLFLTYFAYNH